MKTLKQIGIAPIVLIVCVLLMYVAVIIQSLGLSVISFIVYLAVIVYVNNKRKK